MNRFPGQWRRTNSRLSMALLLAGFAIAAGCSTQGGRAVIPPPAGLGTVSTETAGPVVAERAPRYYVDESGTIWDDSGRKQEIPPPRPAS